MRPGFVNTAHTIGQELVAGGLEDDGPGFIVIDIDLHISVQQIPGIEILLFIGTRIIKRYGNVHAAAMALQTDLCLIHLLFMGKSREGEINFAGGF